HAAFGRRAADARGGPDPAHRRQVAAARRDLRRARTGHRAGSGADDPPAAPAGIHRDHGRAELPLRGTARRPVLRDGAWPDRRGLRGRGAGTEDGHAAPVSRGLIIAGGPAALAAGWAIYLCPASFWSLEEESP